MKLEVLTKDDCEQARIWRNECLVSLRTPYPLTKEQQEQFYHDVICNRNSPHRYWGIHEDGVFIGMGGLTNIAWESRQAEISLILDPAKRGECRGKQAVYLLLDRAFNYLNLDLVYGECYYANTTGQHFWKTIVGDYHGKSSDLRKGKYWNGKTSMTMYFDIEKEEFQAYEVRSA
ncbi:MAG TPA: GNAT family N-acetyltransferase [Planctomycetes bacterium]|nr:GNAT family N-acetyltransferase [Planctomycetota bacterium]